MTSTQLVRRTALGAVAALAGAALVVAPTGPASAFGQYCGKDQAGIHLGGYAPGSLDNGHPDPKSKHPGWAGLGAVKEAKTNAFKIERIGASVEMSEKIFDAMPFDDPSKEIKLGFSIASLITDIAGVAADSVVRGLEHRNAEMVACGSVFLGDTVDLLFVARMQEELAGINPADGPIKVPSNIFVLPDDGNPDWNRDSTHYRDRPEHNALGIPYADGFANDEYIGVATMVRNEIAHLEAHGINTGGGTVWKDGVGLVHVDGAKDLWWDGIHLLQDGRLRLAYAKFAEAYRMAVELHTTS